MRMTRLTLLLLLLGTTTELSYGQANSDENKELVAFANCKANLQSGTTVCSAVLPATMDTKRSKVGEHLLLKVDLATGRGALLTTTLDAAIIEIQPAEKGRSKLRLRIDRVFGGDGRQFPVQANVLAMVSQSSVTEGWHNPWSYLIIIADRFARIPEDDERLPGERKSSEDQRHTSPLDAMPDRPVHAMMICNKNAKNRSGDTCVDLLEARGIYGYKGVMLEPVDAASPSESVFSSKKDLRLRVGTILVLEVKNVQGPGEARAVPAKCLPQVD
jgi:hypothetical protein